MSHSFVNSLHHCVFSTKERRPMITPELQPRLFQYVGGIARENKIKLLAAGGARDHVHLLISMPSTISISKAMQLIKGGSSKWIHETFTEHRLFEWQEGYGAFSIGIGDIERTTNYINNQAEHHNKMDFKTEFRAFFEKTRHRIRRAVYFRLKLSFVPCGTSLFIDSVPNDKSLGY